MMRNVCAFVGESECIAGLPVRHAVEQHECEFVHVLSKGAAHVPPSD